MSDSFLPFHLPSFGPEEKAEVVDSIDSGWVTTGPKTARFEKAFAEYLGVGHALGVNSATAGLHLALEAIGLEPGDKVLTTPYTFTASAEVIRYFDAHPVFADIDAGTLNIDPEQIARILARESGIKAIMPVHIAGQACDMQPIQALAEQYGLKIIEDAAHALPTTYRGAKIGTIGDITVYSFYATKTLATGEGGMIVTDNDAWAQRMRTMRLHGISRDVFQRYSATKPSWYYEVVAPGFKYNLTDLASALGIHQLNKLHQFRDQRAAIARQYDEAFNDLPLRRPSVARPEDEHAWHLYIIQLDLDRLRIDRDRFIELMCEHKIGTSVHFIPLHLQPYWQEKYNLRPEDLPNASHAYSRVVSLPIYPRMTPADVQRVITAVRAILEGNQR